VDYDNCVAALIGDVVDEGVRVVILDAGAVPVFFGPCVDENEAGVTVAVDVGGSAVIGKVPKEGRVVFVGSLFECCVGRTNSCWSYGSAATSPRMIC
jgi:hypothetical protein